jgi:integrase
VAGRAGVHRRDGPTAAADPVLRRLAPGGGRRDGDGVTFHDLRHYYASLLIRHGESVKVVQKRLGHKSAVETLDTYSHLWPDSEDRTREAVDEVLGRVTGGVNARMAS